MDVRCDRCETEYELDDAIVTDTGASVQCTTCGHTFVVNRQGVTSPAPSRGKPSGLTTPSAGTVDSQGPDVPEWTLSTDDGKVHRFRDLNVLQKWIVERKVTRTERISRLGGPWLSLGDVVELAPFFAVVDEADRARAAIPTPPTAFASSGSPPASSRPPPGMIPPSASRGSTPARPNGSPSSPLASTGSVPPAPPPQAGGRVSEDGPTVPNRRLSGMMAAEAAAGPSTPVPKAASRPAEPKPGIRPPDDRTPTGSANVVAARANAASPRASTRTELVFGSSNEAGLLDSELLEPSHTGRNMAIAVVLLLLAAGGGGAWWYTQKGLGGQGQGDGTGTGMTAATTETAAPVAKPPAAGAAAPTVAQPEPTQAKPTPAVAEAKDKAPETKPEPAAEPKKVAAEAAAGDPKTATVGPGAGARGRGGAKGIRSAPAADAGGAQARGGSYELLVRQADRLLDAGKSAQADKLYTQALATRPDGVAALTGSAYVMLDRQRHFKAIETFRKALSVSPGYGPALFGIAESYRARGDTAQALGAYRQYLAVAPTGTDAPAARRQIKDLESASPAPSTVERPAGPASPDP